MMQQTLDRAVPWSREAARAEWLSDPWIWSAVVAAILVRLVRLDAAPMWFDEVVTAQWITLPWGEMVRAVAADYHPPLYFLLLKGWSELVGTSPWDLRVLSVLLSLLTVPLVGGVAAILVGRGAARWAAWAAACCPFLVHHGQETRMYGLVAALAAVNMFQLARAATHSTRSLRWSFVVVATALIASHYYCIFFVGGELIALALLRLQPARRWLPASVATAGVIVVALIAAAVLPANKPGGMYQLGWLPLPGVIWSMLSGYTLLPSSEELHALGWHAALPYLPVALIGISALAVTCLVGARSMRQRSRIITLAVLAAALAGPFAVRLVLPASLNPRYFAAAMPPFLVLVATGMDACARMRRYRLAALAVGIVMVAGSVRQLIDPGYGREDIRGATTWLDANVPQDEALLVSSYEMALLARYHWPTRHLSVYPDPGVIVTQDNVDAVASRLAFPGLGRAIYVLGRTWVSDPEAILQRTLTERYRSCGGVEVQGIRVLCLSQSEAPVQHRTASPLEQDRTALRQAKGGAAP
jgi:hypothetical protein